MKKGDLISKIDKWICDIWTRKIKEEYNKSLIREESVLQSSLYYHLREKAKEEARDSGLFVYFEMPFKADMHKKYKKHPRIDLVIMTMRNGEPVDLSATIEVKYYDYHQNSPGLKGDFYKMRAAREGIYYPYGSSLKLIPDKGYLLYLVEEGSINLSDELNNLKQELQSDGFFTFLIGLGDKGMYGVYR